LWIADQVTDRVELVRLDEAADDEYGVPWLLRDLATESSNTSGLTAGEGSLWLAANGSAKRWRAARPTDAADGSGEILRVDPETGKTRSRHLVPGGGGTHGVEYDRFEEGTLWVTTLRSQTLTQMRIADWSTLRAIPLPYPAAHGVVRVADGVWVVHKMQWAIVKLDPASGRELDRIEVPQDQPEIHCLTAFGEDFLYCDATSGWVVQISA
jgi:sugar lactone lactonase YvrE